MPNCLTPATAIILADGSTIYKGHKNLNDMFTLANRALELLLQRFTANTLHVM